MRFIPFSLMTISVFEEKEDYYHTSRDMLISTDCDRKKPKVTVIGVFQDHLEHQVDAEVLSILITE